MKIKTWMLPALLVVVTATSPIVRAGDLDPPGPPAPTMVTLQEIHDRIAPAATPDTCFDDLNRFVTCGDGSVKDILTDLVWLVRGDCIGQTTWTTASVWAAQLADGQCGLSDGSLPGDWRLPTEQEWQAIFDQSNANSCVAPFFPDITGLGCCSTGTCPLQYFVSGFYWSSTTRVADPADAQLAAVILGSITITVKNNIAYSVAVKDLR